VSDIVPGNLARIHATRGFLRPAFHFSPLRLSWASVPRDAIRSCAEKWSRVLEVLGRTLAMRSNALRAGSILRGGMEGTTLVAWLALLLTTIHIGWQIWWQVRTHRRRPEDEIRVRDALRRSDAEREALNRVHAALPPVIQICTDYIEQFPEGRPASVIHINPRKVRARLTRFQGIWQEEEPAITVPGVRDAYGEIGVGRVLSEIASKGAYPGELVPTVKALQASLMGLRRTITEALR
jgi:hypothetical protein